ncbi:uncharacterized protein [Coffea arabica]|uniref:Uncharacterized protein n=1 Tax=Coffea arabica TaxID=13443 RepID=A0ABM4U6G0_COFAR
MPRYCSHCYRQGHGEEECHVKKPELWTKGLAKPDLPVQRKEMDKQTDSALAAKEMAPPSVDPVVASPLEGQCGEVSLPPIMTTMTAAQLQKDEEMLEESLGATASETSGMRT